jgi:hypothetical protein
LLKTDSSGNIRGLSREKAAVGSERETAMRGIGKSSMCKSSMWTAAGFAFVSGLVLLQPTQASAQFNIEGIIRGALQQQGCCYGGGGGYYQRRSSGSGTTRHVKNPQKDDSPPVDKTKEKDATQVEAPNNNVASGRQQTSAPAPAPSQPDNSTRQTSATRVNDDQPAFAPSR